MFDCLIRGATVIDGTRAPRFDADVALEAGRIAAIGDLSGATARTEHRADGRILAPGFVDSHTHDDHALLAQPDLTFKVSQGVTTVIGGNCGVSIAPLPAGGELPAPLNLIDAGAQGRFASLGEYFAALRRAPAAVNVAMLAGHTSLRVCCMADLQRTATAAEAAAMRGLLERALDDGAIGLSTGTFYPPAAAASTEEIIEVGRPLAARAGLFTTHMRSEADAVIEAMEETFRIGRELGVPVLISHHKVMLRANHGRSGETLARIVEARRHQCVALDCYPYTAGSTMIRTEPAMLEARVLIASSVPHPECAGRELADIAAEWNVSRVEAARRLQPGSAVYFLQDEADVRAILAFDDAMVGSDGIPLGPQPHPRLWGTFPRVLGRYCRELGLFPLETAVWKMTGLTARHFGLRERGTIAVGHHADLVLFDAATVRDTATYEQPVQPAAGIDAVWVNGQLSWHGGRHTGARGGAVITGGGAAP
ncbi:MAG: D-aminoacylase [Burkholderiaceae bacterium]